MRPENEFDEMTSAIMDVPTPVLLTGGQDEFTQTDCSNHVGNQGIWGKKGTD